MAGFAWSQFSARCTQYPMQTDGTKRGVRLTAEGVAQDVVKVIDHEQGWITKVHFPSGLQAKVLYAGSMMSPSFLTRFFNAKFTTKRKIGF